MTTTHRSVQRNARVTGGVLRVATHHFEEGGGATHLALLAESHIAIHTWPETGFIAVDIFMCGEADAKAAVAIAVEVLRPERADIMTLRRGGR